MKELKIPHDKWDLFSNAVIDVMYDCFHHANKIEDTKQNWLLFFLNDILERSNLDLIDNVNNFAIDRSIITQLNGEEFINLHKKNLR